MHASQGSAAGPKPARALFVWAAVGIAAAAFSLPGAGQQADTPPPLPPPGPPPQVVFQHTIAAGDLAFLASEVGQPTKTVLEDKRFKIVLKAGIPNTMYDYGPNTSLKVALDSVLEDSKLPMTLRDGRYAMLWGHMPPLQHTRAFLWIDLQQGIVLGGFYSIPINGEPTPTLAIFSKQLGDTNLSVSQLPPDFAQDVAAWTPKNGVHAVTVLYFIPENGKKYVLLHDEDFCDHPPNTPAPDPMQCEQLNEKAADDDMNAALFMKETGNKADATALWLDPEQVAWISMRESKCGLAVACRIQVTQARTRVLMGTPVGRR